jgi:hypothetical protein
VTSPMGICLLKLAAKAREEQLNHLGILVSD